MPAHILVFAPLAILAGAATWFDVLGPEAHLLAISYGALLAAQVKNPILLRYNRIGDYSYGVYIYGWPIQQMVVSLNPTIHPLLLMTIALPAATLCGAISWYLIERPALGRKHALSQFVLRIMSHLNLFPAQRGPKVAEQQPAAAKD